ncbi:MAG: FIST C-terminal domain-containing protein [Nitrospinae bacterium]|nr:FIST C-terminal domain-containing protein [Nitrospinota bacterium]
MESKGITAKSVEELRLGLDSAISAGFSPTLVIAFASTSHDIGQISEVCDQKGVDLFCCSTAGEICGDNGAAGIFEESISLLLLNVDKGLYRISMFGVENGKYTEAAAAGAQWAASCFAKPALIAAQGGFGGNGDDIVKGIFSRLDRSAPVFGGLAGDDLKMSRTQVGTNGKVSDSGLLFLVFDNEKIEVSGVASSGWLEVGVFKTVTSSSGNVIHTIDGEPALEVYRDYLGDEVVEGAIVGVTWPIYVWREDGGKVLRESMYFDHENGSISYSGNIPQGSKIKFAANPGDGAIKSALADIAEFKQEQPDTEAIILFSCKARHVALGPMIRDEVVRIYQLWNAPMAGFFTYGEIGAKSGSGCDFHNLTCVVVSLKEKAR